MLAYFVIVCFSCYDVKSIRGSYQSYEYNPTPMTTSWYTVVGMQKIDAGFVERTNDGNN